MISGAALLFFLMSAVMADGTDYSLLRHPELLCGRRFMQVGLHRAHLEAGGLDPSSTHLADTRCTPRQENQEMLWFVVWDGWQSCGTKITTNSTHAIYSNTIFVYPVALGNGNVVLPERFPFSCVYLLDAEAMRPDLSVEGAVVGVGPRPRAGMSLYRNDNYTDPYSAGVVTLPLGSPLYVGVSAPEAASDGLAVILENCYSTPSAKPDHSPRFSLIQSRCPSNRRLVKVEEGGPSLPGRFTVLVNLFSGDYDPIFLHCSLSMCDPTQAACSQSCRSRVSRSVALDDSLTIGPISWKKVAESTP